MNRKNNFSEMSLPKIESHIAQNHFSYCANKQFFKVPQKKATPAPVNYLCVPNTWQPAEPAELQKI